MKYFLEAVAEACHHRFSPLGRDLNDVCFVFPNKRGATFFNKYMLALSGRKMMLAPTVTTVSDLMEDLSGMTVDSRINLVFRLYRCYRSSLSGKALEEATFDRFRMWGETALSDFNEVDTQIVDDRRIDELFSNVRDFRSIRSDFLTDDQKNVIEKYFGVIVPSSDTGNLWINYSGATSDASDVRNKFFYIWQVMSGLYHRFRDNLAVDGLVTPGGASRMAVLGMERLLAGAAPGSLPGLRYRKYVFVGFNVLSGAERRLFAAFRDLESRFTAGQLALIGADGREPLADFYWDCFGPMLMAPENSASLAITYNTETYPAPQWAEPFLKKCDPAGSDFRDIKVCAIPSASGQVKLIGKFLGNLVKEGEEKGDDTFKKALKESKVAVALPDEALLQPLLYSIPDEVGEINLTMGLPMKLTAAVSLLRLLRRMVMRARRSGGRFGFYALDVRAFLAHPYMQRLFSPEKIRSFLKAEDVAHATVIADFSRLAGPEGSLTCRAVDTIFRIDMAGAADEGSGLRAITYMRSVLSVVRDMIGDAMHSDDADDAAKSRESLRLGVVERYIEALNVFENSYRDYASEVRMNFFTASLMAERMIAMQTVSLEGEPLKGLQVMGMLETRSLDFDYIFIPSMNEKIMPRRARMRTFIPNVVRLGHGMPPANYQEDVFAYYFYRLLSRARNVCLLYDSRVGDRTGGVSRFVLQLRYMFSHLRPVQMLDYRYHSESADFNPQTIARSPQATEDIETFRTEKGKNLSASALISFLQCPLKFYWNKMMDIRDDNEPTETIADNTAGTIIHEAMESIYTERPVSPDRHRTTPAEVENELLLKGKVIDRDFIQRVIDDGKYLKTILTRSINKWHFCRPDLDAPLVGSPVILLPIYVEMVRKILRYDMTLAPFTIRGCEFSGVTRIGLGSGNPVNVSYSIDRIDSRTVTDPKSPICGKEVYRVVDYKTGSPHLRINGGLGDVFSDCTYKNSQPFQLLFYSLVLRHEVERRAAVDPRFVPLREHLDDGVAMEIYSLKKLDPATRKKEDRSICIGNQELIRDTDSTDPNPDSLTLREDYKARLDETIDRLFDPEAPFTPASNPDNCNLCNFRALCALTPGKEAEESEKES